MSILSMAQDEGWMRIEVDACQYAIGGILFPRPGKIFKPIAFFLKLLSDTEWNYEVHDQEMLVIMKTLQGW